MSYVERTAKKLLPILNEVKRRMIPDKKTKKDSDAEDEDDMVIDLSKVKNKALKSKNAAFDMKNILGYLNQGENL
jgi:hypothetical protein